MPPERNLGFEIISRDPSSSARTGCLTTRGFAVQTPVFMPVGTAGTVKAMLPWTLADLGFQVVLANTYHLALRPGVETIARLGGLRRFMAWPGAILTDSGGYQVYSLASNVEVRPHGVTFQSHLDGDSLSLTPEDAVAIQHRLGSDIIMPLDECLAHPASHDRVEASVNLTLEWLDRTRAAHAASRSDAALFGIVQGGIYPDMRELSARATAALDLDGHAIGGLSVGEGPEALLATAALTARCLPENKPRYLMGVGRPQDLLRAIGEGIDMFDCVLPTRNARNGQVFTRHGRLKLRHASHREDPRPIDQDCLCPTCRHFSRAYMRHLFNTGEILASILATTHNLAFYAELITGAREAIRRGAYTAYRDARLESIEAGDPGDRSD